VAFFSCPAHAICAGVVGKDKPGKKLLLVDSPMVVYWEIINILTIRNTTESLNSSLKGQDDSDNYF